jgi:hypothetical protein
MSRLFTAISIEGPDGAQFDLMDNAYRRVDGAQGFRGLKARTVSRPRVGGDGAINSTRYLDERLMSISGLVLDRTTNDPDVVWAQWDDLAAAVGACADTERLMMWSTGTYDLQAKVKLEELQDPVEVGPNVLRYQATFHNELGLAFSQQLQTEVVAGADAGAGGGLVLPSAFPWTFLPVSSTTVAVINGGSRPAPVVLVLRGGMSNPTVVCGSQRIVINGDIASGDELWVDTGAKSVLLNNDSTADRRSMLRAAQSRWFYLPARASTLLELRVDDFDSGAELEVQFRDAH